MNLPKLFNTTTGALLESELSMGRAIAVNTFDAILKRNRINEEMVIESLKFLKSKLNNEDMRQLCEYFADVHDINFGFTEI